MRSLALITVTGTPPDATFLVFLPFSRSASGDVFDLGAYVFRNESNVVHFGSRQLRATIDAECVRLFRTNSAQVVGESGVQYSGGGSDTGGRKTTDPPLEELIEGPVLVPTSCAIYDLGAHVFLQPRNADITEQMMNLLRGCICRFNIHAIFPSSGSPGFKSRRHSLERSSPTIALSLGDRRRARCATVAGRNGEEGELAIVRRNAELAELRLMYSVIGQSHSLDTCADDLVRVASVIANTPFVLEKLINSSLERVTLKDPHLNPPHCLPLTLACLCVYVDLYHSDAYTLGPTSISVATPVHATDALLGAGFSSGELLSPLLVADLTEDAQYTPSVAGHLTPCRLFTPRQDLYPREALYPRPQELHTPPQCSPNVKNVALLTPPTAVGSQVAFTSPSYRSLGLNSAERLSDDEDLCPRAKVSPPQRYIEYDDLQKLAS